METAGLFEEVVEQLRALQPWQLPDDDLNTRLSRYATLRHTIDVAIGRLAVEADDRKTWFNAGHNNATEMIANTSVLNIHQAGELNRIAKDMDLIRAWGYGVIADAHDSGLICGPHARMITKFLKRHHDAVNDDARAAVADALLEPARLPEPHDLKNAITTLAEALAPDHAIPEGEDRDLDSLHVSRTMNGRVAVNGDLNAHCGEMLLEALDALNVQQTGDSHRDERTPTQMRHDALEELARRALAHGDLPDNGGLKPQVYLCADENDLYTGETDDTDYIPFTIPEPEPEPDTADCDHEHDDHDHAGPEYRRPGLVEALLQQNRRAWLRHGGRVTRRYAQYIACDADVIPVHTKNGRPVEMGGSHRYPTRKQRQYLNLRDRGCCFPGCRRPPSWTDVHHIKWWSHGGKTVTSNLMLLCKHHHTLVHLQQWVVEMGPDETPIFTPPYSVDPFRRPIPANGRGTPAAA